MSCRTEKSYLYYIKEFRTKS